MRWTTDVARGQWLHDRMETLDDVVLPPGFEAYARVSNATAVTDPAGESAEPSIGTMDQRTLAVLAEHARSHTACPEDVIAGIWEGRGGLVSSAGRAVLSVPDAIDQPAPEQRLAGRVLRARNRLRRSWSRWRAVVPLARPGEPGPGSGLVPAEIAAGPRLELPDRGYLLCELDLEDIICGRWATTAPWLFAEDSPDAALSPSLLWPADHTWVIATEIDLDFTIAAGPRQLIEEVCADDRIEAETVDDGGPWWRRGLADDDAAQNAGEHRHREAMVAMNDFDAAWDLVRARDTAAQLYIWAGGQTRLCRGMRCRPESLLWTFSVSKPLMALVTFRLRDDGRLELDAPVARYWPEFGQHGKSELTIRDVLRHRTGMPLAGSAVGDGLALPSRTWSRRRIAAGRPRLDPSAGPAYQWVSFGDILGEVAHRITGLELAELERHYVLEPLGMHDTFLGVPTDRLRDCVPLTSTIAAGRLVAGYLNQPVVRRAPIPSAGLSTTAASLGRLYRALVRGGTWQGARVITAASLAEATTPSAQDQVDQYLGVTVQWAQGFQLGGTGGDPNKTNPLGRTSTPRRFGHNGSGCCVAWADPERDLVVVYLTNLLDPAAVEHQADVADAITAVVDRD